MQLSLSDISHHSHSSSFFCLSIAFSPFPPNMSLFGLAFSFFLHVPNTPTALVLPVSQYVVGFHPCSALWFYYLSFPPFSSLSVCHSGVLKVNKADWLSLSSVCLPENRERCRLAIRNTPLHSGCLIVASCFSAVQLFTQTRTQAKTKTLRLG